jgi:hypothetical protein
MRRILLALLLGLAVLDCGNSTAPNDPTQTVYTLRTVNGEKLPSFEIESIFGTYHITGGKIALRPDSTFLDVFEYFYTFDKQYNVPATDAADTIQGTFKRQGDTLTFAAKGVAPYTAVLHGNDLVESYGSIILGYRR